MSMFSNLFHKNSAAVTPLNTQSSLVNNPVMTNAPQMNNEFLNHHKTPLINQQGSLLSQAPIAPIYQSVLPTSSWNQSALPTSSWNQSSLQRGTTYRRGGPYRQIRLRTHNWGTRSENGWSGFNNWRYQPQNLSSWEPKSFLLEELRAQGARNRGLNFQQPSSFVQQPTFIQQAPLVAPITTAQPILFNGKQSRGHHHGLRKKRAQAVLPVQPIGGGPAIATIAPTPILSAPIMAAPIAAPIMAAPIATRDAGLIAAPIHETRVMPTIFQETVRTDRVLEVQPVLHREIEQPVVNHIEKHITEAPATLLGGTVRMAPIVQETRSTRVIDEVQPIVHRQVAIAQVERVEEHLTEHIVAPTQHTNSVVNEAFVAQPVLNNSSSFVAPVAPFTASPALSSAPLSNTTPITKVVPNFAAAPLLEKQQQAPIAQPVYGSAMM